GLAAYNFNHGAAVNTGYGEIILGSNEGAIVLADSMRLPEFFSSHMVLDNLSIMYRPVYPGEKGSPLKKMLNETSSLELKYNQNTFSINVSSVNYDNPSNIYYTWKLEGFFDEWSTPSEDGMIKYTNLSPGEYKLRIRAILLDNNQLLEERSISIVIESPLWLTPWAILLYIVLVSGAAFSLYRYKMIKKDRRISQEKINFFIHTAHDIRTPLTLIKAPLGEILRKEKLSEEGTKNINLAMQSTDNLSELANKLMNFQKEELYSPQVIVRKCELNSYFKEYLQQFRNYAEQQEVRLEYRSDFDEQEVWIDRNKMDSILRNLITNALKYTPKGGSVSVIASCSKRNWNVDITDTGIGIPKKDQKKMFKYMFRGYNATNQLITGSGIGMLLTWRLIQNHEGRVSFSSEENAGTSFHLSFPIKSSRYIYRDEDVAENKDAVTQEGWAYTIASQDGASNEDSAVMVKELPADAPNILIVEDNDVLRNFLLQSLSDTYHVSGVENGKEALDQIRKVQPDLIISDVMMPVMNGHDLCKAVKGNMATSHIPFIMLTALGDKKDIIDGLKTKADLYIVKPFDITILKANMSNVLENRDLIRKRIQELLASLPQRSFDESHNEISSDETDVPEMISTLDDEFIRKVTGLIKEGLGKGLNVDTLCAAVNMSRTSFYNKIKALTGEPPAELIRNTRMQEAAILLKTKDYTVSEVSDMLGFADPKYFADTFKKYYGVPPRDYMKSVNN
ncbi:MAG: response regulator, partial [Phocaeicola sp.]